LGYEDGRDLQHVVHLPAFDDVYSINTLLPRPNGLLVCNLDLSHRLGNHWVAIYVNGSEGYGEYFDSIGELRRTSYKPT